MKVNKLFLLLVLMIQFLSSSLASASSSIDISSFDVTNTNTRSDELQKKEKLDPTDPTDATDPTEQKNKDLMIQDKSFSPIDKTTLLTNTKLIDSEGYTLVGTATELKAALVAKQLKIRLTANITMGTDSYLVYNGLVLDGGGHIVTYNKSGNPAQGFYINEANAIVWMKNIQFGTLDGNGATGWYGLITCYAGVPNMKLHLENISYYSANGQALFNPDGQIYFHGINHFEQVGVGSYSQEWAETNYIEIVDGETTVNHNTNQVSGFIYSTSTLATNTSKNSVNLIVRSNATFDVVTNHTAFYNSTNFAQNIHVESNGYLAIKQTEKIDAVRKQFIYPDLSATAVINYQFDKESKIKFDLTDQIRFNRASGELRATENDFTMIVDTGTLFYTATVDAFRFILDAPKKLSFSSSSAQTIGLNSATSTYQNVILTGLSSSKTLHLYEHDKLLGSIDKPIYTNLKAGVYSNLSNEANSSLSSLDLSNLSKSTKWVLESKIETIIDVDIPMDMSFHTKNSDIGTDNQGQLYNDKDYNITNNGNSDITMILYQFILKNEDAESVKLLDTNSTIGIQSMYLTLSNKTHIEPLTDSIDNIPFGTLAIRESQQLKFGGVYNNSSESALSPKYSLIFRFEVK